MMHVLTKQARVQGMAGNGISALVLFWWILLSEFNQSQRVPLFDIICKD